MIEQVLEVLRGRRWRVQNEAELQVAIAEELRTARVPFSREVMLSCHERIDFMVGDVGVEVKVDGSVAEIARQLQRYAGHEAIAHLVLATTRVRHITQLDQATFAGKRVTVVHLAGGWP
ncbi:MAG TPA: hypothetical protein VK252_09590 [Solirubrobacteraceae bacterium]|nr:hypothetical protein [Solirubrobacteraceae bacterium]